MPVSPNLLSGATGEFIHDGNGLVQEMKLSVNRFTEQNGNIPVSESTIQGVTGFAYRHTAGCRFSRLRAI
jgi:hypothetical protein